MTEIRGVFSLRLAGILNNANKWVDLDAVVLNRHLTTAELPAIGYISGGYQPAVISNTEKVNYSDDTISAVPGGNLTQVKGLLNSVGDTKHGYFSGGIDYPTVYSNIDKLEYATETMGGSPSDLLGDRHSFGTLSNNTDGYFIGGNDGSSRLSSVEKINYSTNTVSSLPSTFLKYETEHIDGTGTYEHGYLFSGYAGAGTEATRAQTMWNKLYYSTDTLVEYSDKVSNTGSIYKTYSLSATSSLTDAYFMGGYNNGTYSRKAIKLNYLTDTAQFVYDVLDSFSDQTSATGSFSTGYFFGGHNNGTFYSSVYRINFSNDTYQTLSSSLSGIRGAATATSPRENPISKFGTDLKSFEDGSLITDVGYFAGGHDNSTYQSIMDKLTYSTDTTEGIPYLGGGGLSSPRSLLAATGNSTHGYFGGGAYTGTYPPEKSTMYKLTYSNDQCFSLPTASLSEARYGLAATGNQTAGYFGGGGNSPAAYSEMDKLTYSTDTILYTPTANLIVGRYKLAATGNLTHGYFGGGLKTGGWPAPIGMDKLTYSTDTTTYTSTATLSNPIYIAATGNSTHGYFGGGASPGGSMVTKLDYSSDTTTLNPNLSSYHNQTSATGNSTAGYFGGGSGNPSATMLSTVDKINYSNDTTSVVSSANLSIARYNLAAASPKANAIFAPTPTASTSFYNNSPNTGYFGGGDIPGPGKTSSMDKLTYSNDTTTYIPTSNLSQGREYLAATGNLTHGYFGGGDALSGGVDIKVTTMDRLTYSTDTVTYTPTANLSHESNKCSAIGNQTTGYFNTGGDNYSEIDMDKLTYSTETTSLVPTAFLSTRRNALAATGNLTHGYFGGGYTYGGPGQSSRTTMDKLTYSNDTTTYTPTANLNNFIYDIAATGNSTAGYFAGGYAWFPVTYSGPATVVDKLTYSNDTTTYTPGANLTVPRRKPAATGNSTAGYFGGGSFPAKSSMDKLTYSNDTTAAAPTTADLSSVIDGLAATSSKANGLPSLTTVRNNV